MSAKNSDSIKVGIKVRPLLPKEKDNYCWWKIVENSIQLVDSQTEPYYFDYIFDQNASNQVIFDKMAKHIVHSAVNGFNGTIFAYGQTSSGKTYTMMGDEENPGVMVLAVKEIFKQIQKTSDRRFVLRAGYIEIYNEKIYDLLNKDNKDLKIFETSTGIVSVNCEESSIKCENDLLLYLNLGNKGRTVGETNMNERSSRSHAIFRIIIESKKTDRKDEDAVIQSVLNLVDLAGSERADQTGARGTRLKEGGHINKSLLFLSNVIKRLSENEDDKYISFRDSKLTRILQASLGGNALTSIICTIKPNANEETQSTLSFAMRAKRIKNKPHVNETVSDATSMRRLERKIQELEAHLEEERKKNECKIKVAQLEERIKNENFYFITCNSLSNIRSESDKSRRRTWCAPNGDNAMTSSIYPTRLPKPSIKHSTPLITMRPPAEVEMNRNYPETVTEENEEQFVPGELCSFGSSSLKTPDSKQNMNNNVLQVSITPRTSAEGPSLESVEHAFKELQEFTNLETKIDVKHECYDALKQQLDSVMSRNKILENDRLQLIALQDELIVTKNNLQENEQRSDDLQIQISKLTNINQKAKEKLQIYEEEIAELKRSNEKLELENREAVSLDFQFQRFQNKSKLREAELLELLNEKEKELAKLEKQLQTVTEDKVQASKEELLHLSHSSDIDDEGNVCVKCIDLQRVLEDNTKLTHELDKIQLEYKELELSLKEAEIGKQATEEKIAALELQLNETLASSKAELSQLQKENLEVKVEFEKIKLEYTQLECRFKATEISKEAAEEKIAELEKQVKESAEKTEEIDKLKLEYEELETRLKETESAKQAADEKIATLEIQVKTTLESLKNSEEKLQELQGSQIKCKELESRLSETEATQQALELKLTASLAGSEEKLNNLQIEKQEDATIIDNLRKELAMLQQSIELLQTQNFELNSHYKEKTDIAENLQREMLLLQDKYKTLETAWQEQEQSIAKIQTDYCAIQQKYQNLQNEYEKLENSSAQSRENCELLQRENAQVQLEIADLKQRVETAQNQLLLSSNEDEAKAALETTKVAVELREELAELKEKYEEMQTEYDDLSNQLMESLQENDTLKQQCTRLQMQVEALPNAEQQDCDTLKEQLVKLQAEVAEKNSLLSATEHTISEMQEQMKALQNELFEKSIYVEKCEIMRTQIEHLEKERAEITMVCEELQEKVKGSSNESMLNETPANYTLSERKSSFYIDARSSVDSGNEITALEVSVVKPNWEEKLEALQEKLNERELELHAKVELLQQMENSLKEQENAMESLIEKHKEKLGELQQLHQSQIEQKAKLHQDELNNVQLELLQKLEDSEAQFRENLRKYNKEWEEQKDNFEQTIETMKAELESRTRNGDDHTMNGNGIEHSLELNEDLIRKTNESTSLELNKLTEENQELLNKYNILKSENEQLLQRIDKQSTEITAANDQLNLLKEKLNEMKSQADLAQKLKDELQNKNLSVSMELNEMKESQINEREEFTSTIKTLKEEINLLVQKNQAAVETEANLVSALQKVNAEYEEAKVFSEKLQMEIQQKETEYKQHLQQLELTNSENLQLLETQLEEIIKEKAVLQSAKDELQQQLAEMSSTHEEQKLLKDKIEQLTADSANMKTNQTELNSLRESLQEAQNFHTLLAEEKSELQENILKLNEELSAVQIKLEKELAIHETKVLDLQVDREKLLEQVNSLKLLADKSGKENACLLVTVDALKSQINELSNEKTHMQAANETLQAANATLQADNTTLQSSNAAQLKALTELENKLKNTEEKLQSIVAEKDKLQETTNELQQERQRFNELIEQSSKEKQEIKEKEEELQRKIVHLSQQLNEAQLKLQNTEKDLREIAELKTQIVKYKVDIAKQANEIKDLKSQLNETTQNVTEKCNERTTHLKTLEEQLREATENNEQLINNEISLNQQLIQLKETNKQESLALKKETQEIKSSLEEMKLKYKSLEDSTSSLQQTNKNLEESLKQIKSLLDTKEQQFKEVKERLEGTISCLMLEKKGLEEKLCVTEDILKKLEKDRDSLSSSQKKCESVNSSMESSLTERLSPRRKCTGEPAIKISVERKNRRLSVHDDNRRQSFLKSGLESEEMDDRSESSCNCAELEQKLKECEKQLFIRESYVTALNLELKNHPLKQENANLKKRLEDEQEKHRNDIKRHKAKLNAQAEKINELTSVIANTPTDETETLTKSIKVVQNVETQTEFALDDALHKLQSRYEDLKNICRSRYKEIRELEEKLSQKENTDNNAQLSSLEAGHIKSLKTQCDGLKKELKVLQDKYEKAKQVLHMRRNEIQSLRQQLGQISAHSNTDDMVICDYPNNNCT